MRYIFSMMFWLNWLALTWLMLLGALPESATWYGALAMWLAFLLLAIVYSETPTRRIPRVIKSEQGTGNED